MGIGTSGWTMRSAGSILRDEGSHAPTRCGGAPGPRGPRANRAGTLGPGSGPALGGCCRHEEHAPRGGLVEVIEKHRDPFGMPPNLRDDPAFRAAFTWDQARAALEGLPGGGLNIAHECVDRHAREHGERVAVRWRGRRGERLELTYAELADRTGRFAGVLANLGVQRGERVFMLTGRVPELFTAVLGTLKHGAVACTLFSAFGPEPIRQRLALGDARVLVTTSALYRRKVAAIRESLPGLRHIVLVDATPRTRAFSASGRYSTTRRPSRRQPRSPTTWRCSTSRAARPARRRGRSTSTTH